MMDKIFHEKVDGDPMLYILYIIYGVLLLRSYVYVGVDVTKASEMLCGFILYPICVYSKKGPFVLSTASTPSFKVSCSTTYCFSVCM